MKRYSFTVIQASSLTGKRIGSISSFLYANTDVEAFKKAQSLAGGKFICGVEVNEVK